MTAHRSSVRRAAALAATVAAVLVLAACGGEDGTSTGHGGHDGGAKPGASASASASAKEEKQQHNAADVAFAQGMIPHHRQAVTMADLAATRAGSSKVKELAKKIEKAQAPEIETMSGWLRKWGEDVPSEAAHRGTGQGHGSGHGPGHTMPGMMSAEDMAELEGATGEKFDKAFLTMMIAHHEGAVEMAGTELKEGGHQPALDLADDIIAAQNAEITAMRKMLGEH